MTTIADRYTLADRLGSGAMGDVYRATDTQSGETVAVKHLKPELVASNPDMLTRFQREGEALRALNHPNIVSLLDVVSEDDGHYLVMEYISGGDLAGLMSDAPRGLSIEQVLNIALDLADALTRAHRLDIIHRDLKPANILIAEDGTPRLSDFGIAHFAGANSLTDSASIMGTLYYLPPEACMGEPIDRRADIWAFGVVLFEMITGHRPFSGETAAAIISAILNDPFRDPQEQRPEASDDLADLIYRMLEKDRDGRIPSVRLVGAQIEAMMRGFDYGHAPAAAIHDLTEDSLFDTPTPDTGEGRHNLPAQATPFVGREQELTYLSDQLADPDLRLITILGPGGMGKSRLSIEIGRRLKADYRDGAFFVELAKLNDPANIPIAIGEAADYPFSSDGPPRQQILQFLSNKHMLLILDNFEHLLDGTDLVTDIIREAPDVTILATSRTRLNLSGETVYNLDPMDYPDWETPEDALTYSAVQLFMQSAKRTQIDFALHQDDLTYLTRICQLVEGMPLGILLAAAWVDTLSPQEIASEMASGLDILETEMTDLPERQRSMRAAIDYSWRLLSDEERAAFARMSVFRGGCSRKAAQAVSGTSIRMLTALVNKSFLRRDQESGRFEIHELLRQFAEEHLDAQDESDAIRDAHSDYYLTGLADREADLKGRDQIAALDSIEADFENVRAAWLRAVEQDDLAAMRASVQALTVYSDIRSRIPAAEDLLDAARMQLENRSDEEAQNLWGWVVVQREMMDTWGRPLSDKTGDFAAALNIARKTEDRMLEACTLYMMAWAHLTMQEREQAIDHFQQSAALFEVLGDPYYQALAIHILASARYFANEHEGAMHDNRQAAAIRRDIGDLNGLARSLNNLGVGAVRVSGQVDYTAAGRYYEEAITLKDAVGNRIDATLYRANLVYIHLFDRQLEEARTLALQALATARQFKNARTLGFCLQTLAWLALHDEDYDRVEALVAESLALDVIDLELHTVPGLELLLIAALGRRDFEQARLRLRTLAQTTAEAVFRRETPLFAKAVYYAQEGNYERAAELIGPFMGLPDTPSLEDPIFPFTQQLIEQLKAELGEELFRAAVARGEVMDVEEAFQQEFGDWLNADDS